MMTARFQIHIQDVFRLYWRRVSLQKGSLSVLTSIGPMEGLCKDLSIPNKSGSYQGTITDLSAAFGGKCKTPVNERGVLHRPASYRGLFF